MFEPRLDSSTSSSSSSTESESENEIETPDDIRVTDSGVDSEQTSLTTSSETRVIVDQAAAFNLVADYQESSEDVESNDSRNDIEQEIVWNMKNYFEAKRFSSNSDGSKTKRPGSVIIPEVFTQSQTREVHHKSSSTNMKPSILDIKADDLSLSQCHETIKIQPETMRYQESESSKSASSRSSDTLEEQEEIHEDRQEIIKSHQDAPAHAEEKHGDVGKLRNMFEGLIHKNKVQTNTFLTWKSSNLTLKPKPQTEAICYEDDCATPSMGSSVTEDFDQIVDQYSYTEDVDASFDDYNERIENKDDQMYLPTPPESEPSSPVPSRRVSVLELRKKFTSPETNGAKVRSLKCNLIINIHIHNLMISVCL